MMEYEHNLVLVLDYLQNQLDRYKLSFDFQAYTRNLVRMHSFHMDFCRNCYSMLHLVHNLYCYGIQSYKSLVYMLDLLDIVRDLNIL